MAALLRSLVRGVARSLGWRDPRRSEPEPVPELDPYVVSLVVAGKSRRSDTTTSGFYAGTFDDVRTNGDPDPDYSYLYRDPEP